MKAIHGGVTAAKGFLAAAVEAGVKYKNRTDMALVCSEVPAVVAGVFTMNVVKAAPVKWCKKIVEEQELAQAVVLNSGIANACTSYHGVLTNEAMADSVAKELQVPTNYVLTASTGVIGMQLPVERITAGGKKLVSALKGTLEAGHSAAKAIMTTDGYSKECAVQVIIGGVMVTIGGMSKGSGMIHPNMATMLSVVTTDVAISKELLQEALKDSVDRSFNMISVDRDTSTNDTQILLANGLACNKKIEEKGEDYETFLAALSYVNENLAKQMAKDGEGATKLFTTKVIGAKTKQDAVILSKSVITSNLVKTAVYGNDANWGRILCALGYAGVEFDPEVVDLYLESKAGSLKIVENGQATEYREDVATKILSEEEVTAICDMKMGDASATAWGCDLTYEYIRINGDYRS